MRAGYGSLPVVIEMSESMVDDEQDTRVRRTSDVAVNDFAVW